MVELCCVVIDVFKSGVESASGYMQLHILAHLSHSLFTFDFAITHLIPSQRNGY